MKKSAMRLGQIIGKSAREVNEMLKDKGLLQGDPGNYQFTEKGEQYGEYRDEDNGYGGSAHRNWSFKMWDEEVIHEISDDRFPGVAWYCDDCDAYLTGQVGFDDHNHVWKCTQCGQDNDISPSNVRD